MNWGRNAQVPWAADQVEEFYRLGGRILDTARVYQMGETEEMIGEILKAMPEEKRDSIQVHTKAHPWVTKLDRAGVRSQLEASLRALQRSKVEVFYIHSPDILNVSLLETLEICNELYKEGKFDELGVSNFASWDVAHAHYLCLKHGLKAPTVYQGVYNALSRTLDYELLPMARTFGMRVYVFNPLCGGILTGRYTDMGDDPKEGRFSSQFDMVPHNNTTNKLKGVTHKMYRARYWNNQVFAAVQAIKTEVEKNGFTMVEAALRWCSQHSSLRMDLGDAIIFGASSAKQVTQNAEALLKTEKLPESVVEAFKSAAGMVQPEGYFRGYDATLGQSYQYLNKF